MLGGSVFTPRWKFQGRRRELVGSLSNVSETDKKRGKGRAEESRESVPEDTRQGICKSCPDRSLQGQARPERRSARLRKPRCKDGHACPHIQGTQLQAACGQENAAIRYIITEMARYKDRAILSGCLHPVGNNLHPHGTRIHAWHGSLLLLFHSRKRRRENQEEAH